MRIYVYLFIVILIFNNIHIRILTLKWQLHGVQRGSSLYKDLPNIRELRIASVDRLYRVSVFDISIGLALYHSLRCSNIFSVR